MGLQQLKMEFAAALAMLFVAAAALTGATYAWYANNAAAVATGASVQASTAYSLLISNDGTTFRTAVAMDTDQKELVPVSTLGTLETTARNPISANDPSATEVNDLLFVRSNTWNGNYVQDYTEIGKNSVVSQGNVYYFSDVIWLKAAQTQNVYLEKGGTGIAWAMFDEMSDLPATTTTKVSFADFMKSGAEDTVKTASTTANAAKYNTNVEKARAMLRTLRVALVVTHQQNDAVTKDGVFIYQLDSAAINEDNRAITTSGADGADGVLRAAGVTVANGNYTTGAEGAAGYTGATLAANVDNYVADTGIPLIEACAIQGSETTLVEAGGVTPLIWQAEANLSYKVDVYIWMEGCDMDTVAGNIETFNEGIFTGLQVGFCLGK